MTTTYTLKRQLQLRAHMLRTLSSSRVWDRDGYRISFDTDPADSISMTDGVGACYFGLRQDDPFITTGVSMDEAYNIISKFLALMAEEKAKLS